MKSYCQYVHCILVCIDFELGPESVHQSRAWGRCIHLIGLALSSPWIQSEPGQFMFEATKRNCLNYSNDIPRQSPLTVLPSS